MKWMSWCRRCAGPVLIVAQLLIPASTRAANIVEPPTSNDAAAARLVLVLKRIADEGNLFDPAAVSAMLGIPFNIRVEDTGDEPDNCARHEWESRRVEKTTATMMGRTWFHSLASGAGHLHLPPVAINRAMVTGDPAVSYEKRRRVACSPSFGLRDRTTARLSLSGLPAYACIQVRDIERMIPGSNFQQATDGYSDVYYNGRIGDDSATALSFSYRAGTACALFVDVDQDQQRGLRFLRAQYKRSLCQAGADREFCRDNPALEWSDGTALDRMHQHADALCGTIDDIYQAEPLTGETPPSPRPRSYRSPCE